MVLILGSDSAKDSFLWQSEKGALNVHISIHCLQIILENLSEQIESWLLNLYLEPKHRDWVMYKLHPR